MKVVTSLTNETVKFVRALHLKKAREESGLFLAEGLKIVTEAVELGLAPRTLLYSAEAAGHPLLRRAVAATERAGGEAIEVSQGILAKVSRRDNPQTVLAIFDQAFTALLQHNLDSAYQISHYDGPTFIRTFQDALGGAAIAGKIYAKAQSVYNAVLNIAISYQTAYRALPLGGNINAPILRPGPIGQKQGGLPVSMQIVGKPFAEATVFRAGYAYEMATSWRAKRPPLAA